MDSYFTEVSFKNVHITIPGSCKYVTLHGERNFSNMIKLRTLRLGEFFSGPNILSQALKSTIRKQKQKTAPLTIAGFEDGQRRPWQKMQTLEPGKDKETNSFFTPTAFRIENSIKKYLCFCPVSLCQISNLQNHKKT